MNFIKLPIYAAIFLIITVWLIFASLFIPSPEKARLQSLQFLCTDFQTAEQLALEDFNSGMYHITFSGERNFSEKRMVLDSILRAEFNIIPLYTGCVGTTDEVYHYMDVMALQLSKRYGDDFFTRAKQKHVQLTKH